jgi:hypothetical protein
VRRSLALNMHGRPAKRILNVEYVEVVKEVLLRIPGEQVSELPKEIRGHLQQTRLYCVGSSRCNISFKLCV